MTAALTDLLTPITQDQAYSTFVSTLITLGVPADKWRKGGVASSILRVVAITYAGFSTMMVAAVGAGFLETAQGGWLILLAKSVYGVTAIPASFATGSVTLTNTGGGIYTYAAGQASFSNPQTGTTYTNSASFTLPAAAGAVPSGVTIPVVATTAGSAGTSLAGTITTMVTQMLGVTVTNAAAVAGQDAETDSALRARCLNKLGSLSVRGPRSAYAYAVSSATRPDGSPANINRMSISAASSTGQVTIFCASPSGTPIPADIAAVTASIELNARPEAVTVTVIPVTQVPYSPSIVVWAANLPGVDSTAIANKARKAVVDYIASYPIGGLSINGGPTMLSGTGIAAAIGAASPYVVSVQFVGAQDLLLTAGQVAIDSAVISCRLAATS